ncbi:pkb-activating kinase-like protein [Tulasnella sp. 419]|nr:pkb-activating kinase-like protein [Tulasnella sp. 419]
MSDYLIFEKIKHLDYRFPEGFDEDAKDLVQKIFVLDPVGRITIKEIKVHPFFATINWATLWTEPAPPLEHGMVRNPALDQPPSLQDHNHDDEYDVGAQWDALVGGDMESGSDEDEDEEDEVELERIRQLYARSRLTGAMAGGGGGGNQEVLVGGTGGGLQSYAFPTVIATEPTPETTIHGDAAPPVFQPSDQQCLSLPNVNGVVTSTPSAPPMPSRSTGFVVLGLRHPVPQPQPQALPVPQ